MAQTKDFYAVLGVSATAAQDEIKKQYRKLAKRYHPDANASDPKAAERFKEVSEAYTVLGDPEKRKQYDEMRRLGAFGGFGGGSPFGAGRPGATNARRSARPGSSATRTTAHNSGASANHATTLRHGGSGPASGNGSSSSPAERTAAAQYLHVFGCIRV